MNATGQKRRDRPPHLRALLGGMLLMETRRTSDREAEDQIRCYAPARQVMPGPPGMPSPTRPHDFAKRNLGDIEKPAERASVVGSRHQRQPLPVRWLSNSFSASLKRGKGDRFSTLSCG